MASYPAGTVECPKDGSALVPSSLVQSVRSLSPGTIIGEYRVEELLGEGTFGHVYRATHPIIGRQAAIKVLKPAFSADPEMVGRFVEEARAANRIRHRGIIDVFGFGSLPDGRHYYIMEYLEGVSFEHYMKTRGVFELTEALPLLRGIARAMDAAHAAGVVHRDLKPANVFLCLEEDQSPRPKVLDFGIAKLMSSDSGTDTRSGTPLGTPHYMSPEQCRGLNVTKATDVYAFGVMVFELLTGEMPFDAETGMDILMKHLSEPPPRPSEVNPKLPPTVNAPILRMLAKDPVARPSSLTIAVEDLAQATGHTWSLRGPRNSSHAALVAVSVRSVDTPGGNDDARATALHETMPSLSGPITPRSITQASATSAVAAEPRRGSRVGLMLGAVALLALGGAAVWMLKPGSTAPASEAPAAIGEAAPPLPSAAAAVTADVERFLPKGLAEPVTAPSGAAPVTAPSGAAHAEAVVDAAAEPEPAAASTPTTHEAAPKPAAVRPKARKVSKGEIDSDPY